MRSTPRDLGAIATIAITLIATLSLVAFLWLRLSQPAEGATVPSDAWHWTATGAIVVPVGGDSPFLPGDEVVAIGDRSLESWASGAFAGRADPGAITNPLAVTVVRDGRPMEIARRSARSRWRPCWPDRGRSSRSRWPS